MADSDLTAEYRCGYCYQLFDSMTDPRELPCNHVFCLPCLEGEYQHSSAVVCRICQRRYDSSNDFGSMPTATMVSTADEIHSSTELTCDCENCEHQVAVCYCMQCQDKICESHQQAHATYFGKRHKVIPISQYMESPDKYVRTLCDQHKEYIAKACLKCDKLACRDCDVIEEYCTEYKTHHEFRSLEQFKEEITAHFNELLNSIKDKVTEICKLDKGIWSQLAEEEMECKMNIERIEEFCEEQIMTIREECEYLKKRINSYERELTNRVEVRNTELLAHKEQLEESYTKVSRWLRYSSLSDRIQQRHQMTEQLTRGQQLKLQQLQLAPPSKPFVFYRAETAVKKKIHLTTVPLSLTLSETYKTIDRCYSVCHRACGDLLVGCRDGLQFISTAPSTICLDPFQKFAFATIAVEQREGIYVMSATDNSSVYQLELCPHDFSKKCKLFDFSYLSNKVPYLSISAKYIAVSNAGAKQLILYNFFTREKTILHPDIPPWVAYFLPDGDLLCTGYEKNTLTRYQIADGQLKHLWTCENLASGCGVCTDSEGLIYVCSFNKKAIYFISPQGDLLQTLALDILPDKAGQISIDGDELAVPGWDAKLLYTYKIQR